MVVILLLHLAQISGDILTYSSHVAVGSPSPKETLFQQFLAGSDPSRRLAETQGTQGTQDRGRETPKDHETSIV